MVLKCDCLYSFILYQLQLLSEYVALKKIEVDVMLARNPELVTTVQVDHSAVYVKLLANEDPPKL